MSPEDQTRDPAPRGRSRSGVDTRRRLMDTAERLIGERGLQAVSTRDITGAANANSASIHYHFQSKDGLVMAILADRAETLHRHRAAYLDELGGAPTGHALAEAMVRPTIELTRGEGRGADPSYVSFLAALLEEPTMIRPIEAQFGDQYDRYVETLRAICPELPLTAARNRITFVTNLVINAVSPQPRSIRLWIQAHHPSTAKTLEDDLIDFVAGALVAPARPKGRRRR